jgi:prevent-host-death family protein
MINVGIHEAKTRLSELIKRVLAGEEVIIHRAGTRVAKLVALGGKIKRRTPGIDRGKVFIAKDFDAPLPKDLLKRFES